MSKPSFYNHITPANAEGKAILFNKRWGSLAVVREAAASALRSGGLARLTREEREEFESAGFLVPVELDEIADSRERYQKNKAHNSTLAITIELTQACNLACTYCYQNDYRQSETIQPDTVAGVQQYIRNVVSQRKRPIKDVVLRFIGGEPLLQKATVLKAVEDTRRLVEGLGADFHTQIDTNGLLLDANVIRAMDTISVTLTNKADHNRMRVRHNGSGTYEALVKRLKKHAEEFNQFETLLSIRYNVNAFNAKYAADVYRMVKELGITGTEFELYNTVNYDYNELIMSLSRDDFKRLYMEIIRLKVEHGEVVTDFPRPTFAPCSGYTPYTLKVGADGRLSVCDAMHQPRSSLAELLEDPDKHLDIFAEQAAHTPFDNPACGGCSNHGICGGMYFCKLNEHAADNDPCDYLPFDLDEFLRFFAESYPNQPHIFKLTGQSG